MDELKYNKARRERVKEFYKNLRPVIENANIKIITICDTVAVEDKLNTLHLPRTNLPISPNEKIDYVVAIYYADHVIRMNYDCKVDGEDVTKVDILKTTLFDNHYSFKTKTPTIRFNNRTIDHVCREIYDEPQKGSFTTIIGYPGTFKTTLAIQAVWELLKISKSSITHYDLNMSSNYTRIRDITNFNVNRLNDKYIIKQDPITFDILENEIRQLAQHKLNNLGKFIDEFIDTNFVIPSYIIIDDLKHIKFEEEVNVDDSQGE